MKTMTERIIAILILVLGLGFIIWQTIGIQYALTSAPFIALIAIVTEFDEIFKTE